MYLIFLNEDFDGEIRVAQSEVNKILNQVNSSKKVLYALKIGNEEDFSITSFQRYNLVFL